MCVQVSLACASVPHRALCRKCVRPPGSGGSHHLLVNGICPKNSALGALVVPASGFALGSVLANPERRLYVLLLRLRKVEQLTHGHTAAVSK